MNWNKKKVNLGGDFNLSVVNTRVGNNIGVRKQSNFFYTKGSYICSGTPGTGYYDRPFLQNAKPLNPFGMEGVSLTKKYPKEHYILATVLLSWVAVIFFFMTFIASWVFLIPCLICVFFAYGQNKAKNYWYGSSNNYGDTDYLTLAKSELSKTHTLEEKNILNNFIAKTSLINEIEEDDSIVNSLRERLNKKKDEESSYFYTKYSDKLNISKQKLEEFNFNVDQELDDAILSKYENVCKTFENVLASNCIWYIASSESNLQSKSWAKTSVERKVATAYVGVFDFIQSKYDIPVLDNGNYRIYFYPQFLIIAKNSAQFEVCPISEARVKSSVTQFQETDILKPKDSKLIGYTYQYVNKNGSKDKRYSYNPQIPVYEYCELIIQTKNLSFTFMFSKTDDVQSFTNQYEALKEVTGHTSIERSQFLNIDNVKESKDSYDTTLTKEYFSQVCKIEKSFYNQISKLSSDGLITSKLREDEQLGKIYTISSKVGKLDIGVTILSLQDVFKCYKKLGHSIPLTGKEGLCLASLAIRFLQPDNKNIYENLDMMESKGLSIGSELFSTLENSFRVTYKEDSLLFVDWLRSKDINEEIVRQYVISLYKLASIIANADDTITKEEKNWLASLMKFSENRPEGNIKISESSSQSATYGSIEETMNKLNNLTGLNSVKNEIVKLTNFIKIQKLREGKGMKTSSLSYHCVFTGNPGTGKTTVARIIANIYKELGILKKGHLVETDRSGLVAEYVGQTAVKTNKIIDSALDGVLFIDEAYSLVQGDNKDFGLEAISTLLKRMEDDRDRLVVILAGYSEEMKSFIDANPGLQSRFNRYINFDDYSIDELLEIFKNKISENDYNITDKAVGKVRDIINTAVIHKDKNFGNARFVRNLFEKTLENQAMRLSSESDITEEKLSLITEEDI